MEKYLYRPNTSKTANYVVWMAFPGIYSFAMSSLGFLWLYKLIDERDDVAVERVCSDTGKTQYRVEDVDMIGFSFSFDFDFLNVFAMLEKYNIPLKSKDRTNSPLIFAGGPVVTANPEPYKEFFEFFVLGDGEDINTQVIDICKDAKNKQEALEKLSNTEGVYVPTLADENTSVKKVTKKITECVYTPILSDEAFFKDTFILEMARGCANRCGFCLASYINLPLRFVPYEKIIEAIDLGLTKTNKIALLGAQLTAHPKFEEICKYIGDKIDNGEDIEMSVSSLRVDSFKPEIVNTLVKAGQKNLTLALEAGSERLRRVINKNLTEPQIYQAIDVAIECGLKGMKFYGILGLPTETDEDVQEIIELSKRIKKRHKQFDISFGFSTFVPKAHTPFQWCGRTPDKILEKRIQYLTKGLKKIGVKINVSSLKWDYIQAVLSRGDENLTEYLIESYKNGGKTGAFKKAAKLLKIDTDHYAIENYDPMTELPWDKISMRPEKEFLIKEHAGLLSRE